MHNLFPLGDFNANTQMQMNPQQTNNVQVNFTSLNSDYFMEAIRGINSMTESDLITLIKNHIDTIVDRTLSNDESMSSILCHPKFVSAYNKAMKLIPINYERRLLANKLAYEYSIIDNPDQNLLNQFKEISKYVNKDLISKLGLRGLNKHIANNLAMCRFSSRQEDTNVQRLNFSMCKYNAEIFTEQTVIFVYEDLFDRMGELFISSMLEVYSVRELNDFGEDFGEIYSNITLANLQILNNMPSIAIRQVLLNYIDAYDEWYRERRTLPRCSLRSLSQDYGRIVNIVEKMTAEGYNIP